MNTQKKAVAEPTLTNEAVAFVKKVKLGLIATRRADGKSILSDKGTLTVFDRRHLVFTELASPETVERIRCNPEVAVEVVDHLTRRGYRFLGQGKLISFSIEGNNPLSVFHETESGELEKYFLLIEIESSEEISSPKYAWMSPLADLRSRWKMNHSNPWKF